LVYRLGLVTSSERTIFHQLRRIRNRCAHEIETQDFDKTHFKDRMRNIINASPDIWHVMKEKLIPPGTKTQFEDVEHYLNTVGWRTAFEVYFGLIICHTQTSGPRIPRISSLSGEKNK